MKEAKSKLDYLLNAYLKKYHLPGLALGITDQSQMIYSAAVGVRSVQTQEPLQTDHIFHLASVSKPMAATAILQLEEKGKVKLDQKITSLLPYFRMNDERYKEMTLIQILNHTSGMPDEMDYEWDKPQYDDGAAERYVRSLSNKKLIANPGEKFEYSNIAFDLLGDVIAKASGVSFEEYMRVNILQPLQMKESSFIFGEIRKDLSVSPHIWDGNLKVGKHYPYNRRHAPSSTLNSNILEMSHWARAQLNQGEFDGIRLISKESHAKSWKPTVTIDEKRKMGLSWFLEDFKGNQMISHDGWDTGFRSHLGFVPAKKIAIVLMCNSDYMPLDALVHEILDIFI